MELKIKNETQIDDKIYFDMYFGGVKVKNCFVEKGDKGDWMLRLPTKKTDEGIEQVIWLNDKTFKQACKFVRNYF